jgi:hypothetical protein
MMELRTNAMKITLFLLFILCSASAFGQLAPLLTNQPSPIVETEHPQHATLHEMAAEQPLVGGMLNTYTYAQGEQPLWEFGPSSQPVPLGDIARAYRKEKLTAKKAVLVFEKQGS